ncbi:hypothetical protein PV327_005066 [Microctonus hyperodae]|uniref:Uncharacterized protein n=1 Tax=Microctonus hyperodae TaxID=165561 RepID=A0AA39G108_MICHY|nr:hypothetical protein PV327_005066 [Microctonus hyperodae]
MAMKYFMRMSCLLRGEGRRMKYISTYKQSTWNKFVIPLFMTQSRRQRCDSDNESHKQFLISTSLGFFGIFSFGNDEEKLEPIPEMIMTIKRSIFLIQKGEYKKAEQMLHVALRQAQTLQHTDGITYIYDVMANLAFEVGENQKAKDLFTSVMQRLISNGVAQNDKKIIHMSLKVAKILERMGDIQIAEDGYKYCLKHSETHVTNDPDDEDAAILCAMTLDWYGDLLTSQGRFKESLNNYLKAYELCLKVYGRNHEQTAVILNDLGTVCCLLDEHDRAIDYLMEAIEIEKQLTEKQHLSAIYINLGKVYMKKILCDQAKNACTEAFKLAKESNDEECKKRANECLAELEKMLNM